MSFELSLPVHCTSDQEAWFQDVVAESGETFTRRADAFSSKEAKLTAYSAIYEEIGHLQNKIRTLQRLISRCKSSIIDWKAHHNALSSFSKLPDEIYVEIWQYLAGDASNLTTSWVRVSHVCSHWRRLALNTPVLWTWPCIRRPQIAAQMLRRAENQKLAPVLDQRTASWLPTRSPDEMTGSQKLLAQIFPRARVFIADFSHYTEATNSSGSPMWFGSLLNLSANSVLTNLEYIEITYPAFSPVHAQKTVDNQILNLARHSPNLKNLILDETSLFLPQNESSFTGIVQGGRGATDAIMSPRSITMLVVHFRQTSNALCAPIQQILKTLRHLPHLKSLVLSNVFAPLQDDDIEWCETLPLPISFEGLKDVLLVGDTKALSRFLNAISYHPQSTIKLLSWEQSAGSQDRSRRLSHDEAVERILQTATRRISPSINRLSLRPQAGPRPNIWHLSFTHDHYLPAGAKKLSSVDVFVEIDPVLLSRLVQTWPLDNLLHLDYQLSYSDLATWKFFGALRYLRSISLNYSMHPAFSRTFALFYGSSDNTVFDRSIDQFHVNTPTGTMCRICTKSLFYFFSGIQIIHLPSSGNSMAPERLSFQEEILRIGKARTLWQLASRCCSSRPAVPERNKVPV